MQRSPLKRVIDFLGRLDTASVVILIVFCLMTLGSLFPQVPETVGTDAATQQAWQSALQARYGALTSLLNLLGAFHFASSPFFLLITGGLVVMAVICNLRRWRHVWRSALSPSGPRETPSSYALYAKMDASPTANRLEPLGRILHLKKYRVQLESTNEHPQLRAERFRLAQLGTLALHTAVPLLIIAVLITALFSSRTNLSIGPGDAVALDSGSGLVVRNDGFEVLYNADGSPASYEAVITPYKDSNRLTSRLLRVNEPLIMGPYMLYLSSYWGTPGEYGIVLIAARDPGFIPFLAAGILLLLGMSAVLLFPHKRILARYSSANEIEIAGKASRYAFAFEKEFATILDDLGNELLSVQPQTPPRRDRS